MPITYREARYIASRLNGDDMQTAVLKSGLPKWMARLPGQYVENGEVLEKLQELQARMAEHALQVGLIDAIEIHEYLSDALRADMRDIRNDDGSFKPQSEWPEIWGRMMEAGDVEVEYASERSHDGATKDKAGGWDVKGQVQKVKLKFASRVKLMELAMKHKGVDAMVQQKQGDVNVVVVTAERAREVSAAKKRLERVIPVKAEPLQVVEAPQSEEHKPISEGQHVDNKEEQA